VLDIGQKWTHLLAMKMNTPSGRSCVRYKHTRQREKSGGYAYYISVLFLLFPPFLFLFTFIWNRDGILSEPFCLRALILAVISTCQGQVLRSGSQVGFFGTARLLVWSTRPAAERERLQSVSDLHAVVTVSRAPQNSVPSCINCRPACPSDNTDHQRFETWISASKCE
jgi:hypothetical protein